MAFTQDTFVPSSSQANSNAPRIYMYSTSDSISTVTTSGYFNKQNNQLNIGDIIFIISGGIVSILDVLTVSPVTTKKTIPTLDSDGNLGIGTDTPICNLHILDDSGLACVRVENTDADTGILQVQLINDNSKELSIGKLGSNVNFFGTGSGAILNRDGNLNIIADSNDPIIFYTDETDAQALAATEKMRIEPAGFLVFANGAEPWKDINIGAASLGGPVGLRPDTVQYVDSTGASTGIYTLGVAVGEAMSGNFELQHDYLEGSDISFHFHFQGDTIPTGTDKLNFQLEYTVSNNGDPLAAITTITKEVDFDTAYAFEVLPFDIIDGTNLQIGDQFLFTLTRIAASADEYAGDAVMATVGIHYQVDTLGSRQIASK